MTSVKFSELEFLLYPGSGSVGVIVCHEIFGRTEYTRSVGEQLSRSGYWAVVLDLFRGRRAASVEEGHKLRAELTDDAALAAFAGAEATLREKTGRTAKIGSMGFCMGGSYALLAACKLDLDFCVDYYGSVQDSTILEKLRGPLCLVLASEDERVTPWAFQSLLPAAMKYKKRVDVHLYPNTKHAFHRPGWPGHEAVAAKDAWEKTLLFLGQFK